MTGNSCISAQSSCLQPFGFISYLNLPAALRDMDWSLNALQIIQMKLAMVAIDIFMFHYFFRRHLTAVALVRRHFSVAI